ELYAGDEMKRVANRLVEAWTSDIGFVLDRLGRLQPGDDAGKFAGRIDLARVGVFGHSLGGATAAEFCSRDSRCRAGIDIDGALVGDVVERGIDKPFMFLMSGEGDFSTAAEVRQIMADIQSVYDRLPPDSRQMFSIPGGNHFMFSDDGAVLKSPLLRGALRALGKLGIDGTRQLADTADRVDVFFDKYLR
ncbi:MAG TPA: hypothetical protein VKS01_02650, partial [Bryobacteraceae bacterium]|nr:hypothetical protein [Bryobacteraceae bacterium]